MEHKELDNNMLDDKEFELKKLKEKLIIHGWVFLILLGVIIFYFLPKFSSISFIRDELSAKITEYDTFMKVGPTYDDFNTRIQQEKDESLKKIVSDNKEFYTTHFINKTEPTYAEFLSEKSSYVDDMKKKNLVDIRTKMISQVLPSYTEWLSVDGNMTDLEFVNYIESLLRTFQLKTTSKVWIDSLVLVEDESKDTKNIQTQIFYIPLKLDLIWRKADIMEFLYFVQNVGIVNLDEKNNELSFYKDNILYSKVIAWQQRTSQYNIYQNKLMDIESLEMGEYPETSTQTRSTSQLTPQWYLDFIRKWTEKTDEYSITVWLRFYVKWLPTYKIELYVEQVVDKYKFLEKKLESSLTQLNNTNANVNLTEKAMLNSLTIYMDELEARSKKLEQLKKQKDKNYSLLYKEAFDLNYDLLNIEEYMSSSKSETITK